MPEGQLTTVPNPTIKMDGADLGDDIITSIDGLTVEEEINVPAMFSFRFGITDYEKGDWRGIDLKAFQLGSEIKISLGMDEPIELISGEITSLEPTFADDHSFILIRGYDRLHRLRFGTYRRSFKDMKDSDIASSIGSEIGLSAEVDDTGTVHPYVFQNNLSNYEFLLERAKSIGFEMFVDDKTFVYRKSQEDKAAELTLEYGTDFQSFSVRLRTLTEGSEIEVRGWDIVKKEVITSTASAGSEISKMGGQETGFELSEKPFGASSVSVLNKAVVDVTDAEGIAKGRYNVMLKNFMSGDGRCPGNPAIRAGKSVEMKGIGDRFGGIYYITSAKHNYDVTGYTTTFQAKRTAA